MITAALPLLGVQPGVMAHMKARSDHDSWFQRAIIRAITTAYPATLPKR